MKIADFGLSRSLAITREANKRGSMTDLTSLAKRVRRGPQRSLTCRPTGHICACSTSLAHRQRRQL